MLRAGRVLRAGKQALAGYRGSTPCGVLQLRSCIQQWSGGDHAQEVAVATTSAAAEAEELERRYPHPSLYTHFPVPSRSWFFCGKSRPAFEKAAKFGADVAILDLEDSVAAGMKSEMRQKYQSALDEDIFASVKVIVRVNQTDFMDELAKDVEALTRPGVDGFLLPKAETAKDIQVLDELLSQAEARSGMRDGSVKIIPLVESPLAFFHMEELTMSSPRIAGVMAGNADLCASVLCEEESATADAFFSKTALAARAANIIGIGGIFTMLDNATGFESFCRKLKTCGFDGAVTLTPKQVAIANRVFAYSDRELKWASMALNDSNTGKQAIHTIRRSIQESRQMIGPPFRIRAAAILQRNKRMTEKSSGDHERMTPSPRLPVTEAHRWLSQEIHVGKMIPSPIEFTVTHSWQALWDSAFLSLSTLPNSAKMAASLGMPGCPLPFSLLAASQAAFTVAVFTYDARVHLGFYDMFQHRAVFPGDTLRAVYCVDNAQNRVAGDGNLYTIATTSHWMINQHDDVVFQTQKKTMFAPRKIYHDTADGAAAHRILKSKDSLWRAEMLKRPTEMLVSLTPAQSLFPDQVLIHEITKVHNASEMRMLAYLLRLINPHHHDKVRYSNSDILVPGPCVMAATMSNASQSIGEVLYEEIPEITHLNKVNAGDQISTITYVADSQPLEENPDLEQITVRHLGVKNTDISALLDTGVPKTLFSGELSKPSDFESACRLECPLLYHKIACNMTRNVVRVRPDVTADYQRKREYIPEEIKLS